jgi:hypothetical protein
LDIENGLAFLLRYQRVEGAVGSDEIADFAVGNGQRNHATGKACGTLVWASITSPSIAK